MPGAKNFRIYRVGMSCQENGDRVQRQGRPAPRWLLWVRSIAPGFNRGEQSIAKRKCAGTAECHQALTKTVQNGSGENVKCDTDCLELDARLCPAEEQGSVRREKFLEFLW